MTLPRCTLINASCTPYYHCVSRCVRRAFLCGRDARTGYDFEHRRAWIEKRLLWLSQVFAIDICAYAVMSNHYHVVLHINSADQKSWSDTEVVERWQRLHRLPQDFGAADEQTRAHGIRLWRERLGSVSWFMKSLNEPLARLANKEDGCKGRFWEGRFRSQALLDEAALVKCMAYVDLNPIRAGIAVTPENSDHTSIKARLEGRDRALASLADAPNVERFRLPVRSVDYLELVDWTGRRYQAGKRGRIDGTLPPIVERLQRSCRRLFMDEMRHLSRHYFRAIGQAESLRKYRDYLGQSRLKGLLS